MASGSESASAITAAGRRFLKRNHTIRMAAANGDYERISTELDERIRERLATEAPEDAGGSGTGGDGTGA